MSTAAKFPAEARASGGRLPLRAILGNHVGLWQGEDAREFGVFYETFIERLGPIDVGEELLAGELACAVWETRRLRRLKREYMQASSVVGLGEILDDLLEDEDKVEELLTGFARGRSQAKRRVDALLKEAGIDFAMVHARTLMARLDEFERLDRMIMNQEQRIRDVFRLIEDRRVSWARRARDQAKIEEAEVVGDPKPSMIIQTKDETSGVGVEADHRIGTDEEPAANVESDDGARDDFDDSGAGVEDGDDGEYDHGQPG